MVLHPSPSPRAAQQILGLDVGFRVLGFKGFRDLGVQGLEVQGSGFLGFWGLGFSGFRV